MSYAQFEATPEEECIDCVSVARRVFEKGNEALRRGGTGLKKKTEIKILKLKLKYVPEKNRVRKRLRKL